jgi:hypothetical protein
MFKAKRYECRFLSKYPPLREVIHSREKKTASLPCDKCQTEITHSGDETEDPDKPSSKTTPNQFVQKNLVNHDPNI